MTSADPTFNAPFAARGRALVVVAHAHAGTCETLFRQLSPGHEVHLASDGLQALALVRALVPAVLLADVDLPGLDGAALRRALRDDVSLAAVGVMLMAAGAGALGAGAADGEAPLDPGCGAPELLARVGSAVALAQARREAADREAALRAEAVGVLEALKDGFVAFDSEFRYRYVNAEAERLMGQDRAALLGRSTWEVYPDLAGSLMEAAYREALRERKPLRFTNHYQPWDRYFEINAHPAPGGGLNCYFRDVSQERREAILLSSQKRALELAVGGAELGEVLGVLVGACEAQAGHGAIASIMLCDAQREHLHIVAAPRLPAGYRRAIDGMRIGQDRGSCGTAAHTARSIIVTDVRNAPIWKDYRAAALADGLMACWSTPILSSRRQVIGTLAVYYPSVRNPSPQDRTAVQLIERSAALIIERATEVRERREAEAHLRDEVRLNGVLNRISGELAAQLEPRAIVRTVIDGAVALTGAALGAFIERDGGLGELRGTLTTGAWREAADASPNGSPRPAALPDRGTDQDAAQRLGAVRRLTAIGAPMGQGMAALRVDDAALDARFVPRDAGGGATNDPAVDAQRVAHDGPLRAVLVVPVVLSNGSVVGELLLAHDQAAAFSARHETLAIGVAAQAAIAIDNARLVDRLRESAERFELAMSAADMGWWLWSADSGDYRLSDRAGEIFEWDARQPFPLEQARQWIHPEDASNVFERLAIAKRQDDRFDIDHRYVRRDGSIGWVSVCALVQRDADGRAQRMFGILQDITTRKSMESELRRRADALIETDRRKDEFLATLAHELRNPLAPLRTSLELLKRPNSTEAMREQARSIMSRQVTQMVRLIDELIDIARINSGKIELRKQPLPLHDAIEAALEIARPGIEASGHTLAVDLTPEVLTLEVDATRIAQVLSNLLNNAARYTQPGGRIDVRSARRGNQVEVTVSDNGIGIPADMLERVFEMFTQGDAASPRAQGGLGVGLALARKLVELHGGTLHARSDGPSKGSAFVVTLPLAHDNSAAPPAGRGVLPPAAPSPADDVGLRVLIVDDNIDAAESMALVLADEGHAVALAHDGPQGLERATSTPHDVALLDIGLPGFDGCELARRLRAHPLGRGMLLIATTGWGQARDRERSSQAGFDHHLVKPLDPELVRSLITSRQQVLRAAAGPQALDAPNDRTPVTLSSAPSSTPAAGAPAAAPAATSLTSAHAPRPASQPAPRAANQDGPDTAHAERLAEQLQTVAPPALPLAALAAPTGPTAVEGPADGEADDGAPRARVLVVDDSELVLESAAAIIESEGYEVRTASDGVEALDLVRGWKPDVVLLDMHMRTMGGIETAKRLRAEHPFGTMALLMMSGVTLSDAWIEQARATGFDDCIDKTADPDVWLAHLARWTAPRAA